MAERPEDLNLPNTVVTRIIKDAIPDGVNVSKEARLAISKAASVFVLYATSCANNFALKGKRKTINAQDVLSAMEDMEFEQFIEPLQQCQEAFLQEKKEKKIERTLKTSMTVPEEETIEEVEEISDEEGGKKGGQQQEEEEEQMEGVGEEAAEEEDEDDEDDEGGEETKAVNGGNDSRGGSGKDGEEEEEVNDAEAGD